MIYKVKYLILGFENVDEVKLETHDGLTTLMTCINENKLQLTLINSDNSKKYFEIPIEIKTLLDINDTTNYSVYFTVIIDKIIHKSVINLGAPIIFNEDNKTTAQCVINDNSISIRDLELLNLPTLDLKINQSLKISNLISDI